MGRSIRLAPRGALPLVLLSLTLAACGGGDDESTGQEQVKAWSDPVQIGFDTGNVDAPAIAADAHGNATAIFRDHDGTKWGAGVNRYVAGSGWGTAQLLETADDDTSAPRIAMESGGEAFAVWTRTEGRRRRVWAVHFVPGAGWGAPERLENDTAKDAYGATVAYSDSGTAFAAWALSDPAASGSSKTWASVYR